MYGKLARASTLDEQRVLMRQYEKRALDEEAHMGLTLWWYKINPHRSYVKGWIAPPATTSTSSSTTSGLTSR